MGGAATVVIFLFSLLTMTACEVGELTYRRLQYPSVPPFIIPAVFEVEPEDVLAAAGTSVRFDCTFTTTSPASLSWLHDGAVISLDSRHTYYANGSLLISPVAEEDEGMYTCRVTDTISGDVKERTASLALASENSYNIVLNPG